MRARLFPISLLLSSAACSSQADYAQRAGIKDDAAVATAQPVALPFAFRDEEARDGGTREFVYEWPREVSAIPGLAAELSEDRDVALASQKRDWQESIGEAPEGCATCRNRSMETKWKLVAAVPGWLSLSAIDYVYEGGAHGNFNMRTLVWDRSARRSLPGVAMFRSPEALEAALGPKLCAALNAEREKRRGEPVDPTAPDEYGTGFDQCQHVKDATVLVGSSTGKAFDRIGIWFGPYVAGPYAEGAYELDFPVDAAVLRAVKPDYAEVFATR